MSRLPTYFVSHGGGPWPFMKDQFGSVYDELEASLVDMPRQLGERPKAVLVVTSHWEEDRFMVSSGTAPGMIYDYGGFPPHTYQIQYPAPGHPALAERVAALARAARPRGGARRRSAATTTAPFPCCTPSIRRPTCRWCSCRSSTATIPPPIWRWAGRWRPCARRAC